MEIKTWPDLPFWEELVEQSPECTFYHTPLWHKIVADSYKSFSGVTVRIARSESDISAYYTIYQDALRRWGDSAQHEFPEKLFVNLFKDAGDGAKIWIAEKDGKIIAAFTMLYLNRIVTGWHGVALEKYFKCCPNNILHMKIIRDALKNNYRYYDFGPSGGLEGVLRFKESFGTERRSFDSGHWKKRWGTAKQA